MLGIDSGKVTGGTWLYAAYEAANNQKDIELHIATVADVNDTKCGKEGMTSFYLLPGGGTSDYNVNSTKNTCHWQLLRNKVKPDLVIIWGTETSFAYHAMKIMKDIPMAIYMQGVISSVYGHYFEGVSSKYRLNTARDLIDRLNSKSQINKFRKQMSLEQEMFKMADGVIVENEWCEDACLSVNPKLKIYRNMLPIRNVFYEHTWSLDKMQRHTVFTNAGGYPIKGHHILFKALGIVKQRYPDFVCYVPGVKLDTFNSFKRKTGYMKLLTKLITENGLTNNIQFTGSITSEQMAEHISTCNVYVMPSIVENHSSSLIEAMIVGAPVISSLTGGVASLIEHKKNGILYNSLDAESLAGNIIRVFENDDLAVSMANEAVKTRKTRRQNFGSEMTDIYRTILGK